MTPDQFRRLALALPEAVESAHMGHPDFRVRGKIFATLGPDGEWGMVKLSIDEQQRFLDASPDVFEPVPGGWGRKGATRVILATAKAASLKPALLSAWRSTAPKKLVAEHDDALGDA